MKTKKKKKPVKKAPNIKMPKFALGDVIFRRTSDPKYWEDFLVQHINVVINANNPKGRVEYSENAKVWHQENIFDEAPDAHIAWRLTELPLGRDGKVRRTKKKKRSKK